MHVSGKGITPFDCKIKPEYTPETTLAVNWFQLSDGNWVSTDRGAQADQYDVSIRIYSTESVIDAFINQIEANRAANLIGTNIITLSNFNDQEHIFGADLDYTGSISVTAVMESRAQSTWKGFEVSLRLSCLSPSFLGGSGSLPLLKYLDTGYGGESEYTIKKFDSYDRIFSYQDHVSDTGTFAGTFTFNTQDMIAIRRYLATQRGNTITVPGISGVLNPFGRRSSTYPLHVKITEFIDQGMVGMNMGKPTHKCRITMREVI